MQHAALRMGSQEDAVFTQFGQLQLACKKPDGSRVFYPPAIPQMMPAGAPVEVQLAEIYAILQGQCASKFNQLFQYLHQKLAPMGSIDAEHKKKYAELQLLDAKIQEVWDKARGLFDYIPFMNDSTGKVKALSCMLDIEMQALQLTDASKNLGGLIRSETRNQALEYYKKTIKQCEQLSCLASPEDKIRALQTLVERVMRELGSRVQAEEYEIHDALYLYLQYAVRSSKSQIPSTNTALVHLATNLDMRLKEKLFQQQVPDLDVKDPEVEDLNLPENLYIVRSKAVVLPSENIFRNAPWMSLFTTLPVVGRYSQISAQIGALEGIAKALVALKSEFQEQVSTMSRGYYGDEEKFAAFETAFAKDLQVCQGLERLTSVQVRSLSLVPLAPELHAGWNYASALSSQAKVLASSIRLFQQDMNRFARLVNAVTLLKAGKPSSLWLTTRAVCAMLDDGKDGKMQTVITQILAQNALEALRLTKEEQQLPKLVCGPAQGNYTISQSLLMSYLKKGFLRYLHFPTQEGRAINVEFEKVFYTLKYDPEYKTLFDACLQSFDEFRQLHDAYVGQHEKMHALLMKYQFNKDHALRSEADTSIYKQVNEPTFMQKPLVGIVKPLLFRWAFERFGEYCKQPKAEGFFGGVFDVFNPDRIDLSRGEQNLLIQMFAEYARDSIEKRFWDSQYAVADIEKAIKEFERQFFLTK